MSQSNKIYNDLTDILTEKSQVLKKSDDEITTESDTDDGIFLFRIKNKF